MKCDTCNSIMSCDANQQCWCMEIPAILPLTAAMACLCKSCLIEKTNHFLAQQYQNLTTKQLVSLAKPYRQSNMIEQLDYYFENGFMVFTNWYHLKRGTCCKNGCRHCPYRN